MDLLRKLLLPASVVLFVLMVLGIVGVTPPIIAGVSAFLFALVVLVLTISILLPEPADWAVVHDGTEIDPVYALPSSRVTNGDVLIHDGLTRRQASERAASYRLPSVTAGERP